MKFVYEYTNKDYYPKVNDFGDDYHKPDREDDLFSKEFMKKVRSLKRKYRNPAEYAEAKKTYIKYTKELIARYGGKKRLKTAIKLGFCEDYVPFCPILRRTKRTKIYMDNKNLSMDETAFELPDEFKLPYDFKIPKYVDVVISDEKEKGLKNVSVHDTIRDQINDDLAMISNYYKGRVNNPTKLSRKAQRRRILASRYYKKDKEPTTFEEKLKLYDLAVMAGMDPEDDYDPNAQIFYKNVMVSEKDAREIEEYEALRSIGFNANPRSLSKRNQKVVRQDRLKKKTKKKRKGKGKMHSKFMDEFVGGNYHGYKDFAKEMLRVTNDTLKKAGVY